MLSPTHFITPHFSQTANFADLKLRWEIASELALSVENVHAEHFSGCSRIKKRKEKKDTPAVAKSKNNRGVLANRLVY